TTKYSSVTPVVSSTESTTKEYFTEETIDGLKVIVESSSYETLPITNVTTTDYTTTTVETIEEVVAPYTEVKTTLESIPTTTSTTEYSTTEHTIEVIEAPKVSQTTTEYTTTEYTTEEVVEEVVKLVVLRGNSFAEVVEYVETVTSEYITEVKELPKVTEETSTTTTTTYEDPSQKVESTVTEYTTTEEIVESSSYEVKPVVTSTTEYTTSEYVTEEIIEAPEVSTVTEYSTSEYTEPGVTSTTETTSDTSEYIKEIVEPTKTIETVTKYESVESIPVSGATTTTEYSTTTEYETEETVEEAIPTIEVVKTTVKSVPASITEYSSTEYISEVVEAPKVSETKYSTTTKTITEYTTSEEIVEEIVDESTVVLGGASGIEVVESGATLTSEYVTEELPVTTTGEQNIGSSSGEATFETTEYSEQTTIGGQSKTTITKHYTTTEYTTEESVEAPTVISQKIVYQSTPSTISSTESTIKEEYNVVDTAIAPDNDKHEFYTCIETYTEDGENAPLVASSGVYSSTEYAATSTSDYIQSTYNVEPSTTSTSYTTEIGESKSSTTTTNVTTTHYTTTQYGEQVATYSGEEVVDAVKVEQGAYSTEEKTGYNTTVYRAELIEIPLDISEFTESKAKTKSDYSTEEINDVSKVISKLTTTYQSTPVTTSVETVETSVESTPVIATTVVEQSSTEKFTNVEADVNEAKYSTTKTTTEYTTTEYSTEEIVEEVSGSSTTVLTGGSGSEVVESGTTITSEYITEVKELPKVESTTSTTYETTETVPSEFSPDRSLVLQSQKQQLLLNIRISQVNKTTEYATEAIVESSYHKETPIVSSTAEYTTTEYTTEEVVEAPKIAQITEYSSSESTEVIQPTTAITTEYTTEVIEGSKITGTKYFTTKTTTEYTTTEISTEEVVEPSAIVLGGGSSTEVVESGSSISLDYVDEESKAAKTYVTEEYVTETIVDSAASGSYGSQTTTTVTTTEYIPPVLIESQQVTVSIIVQQLLQKKSIANVKVFLFEVLTVVDWLHSVSASIKSIAKAHSELNSVDWNEFVLEWYDAYLEASSLPVLDESTSELILKETLILRLLSLSITCFTEEEISAIVGAWYNIEMNKDSPTLIKRVKEEYVTGTLSSTSPSALAHLARFCRTYWNVQLSSEVLGYSTFDSKLYKKAAKVLGLHPFAVELVTNLRLCGAQPLLIIITRGRNSPPKVRG
ncbi:hypothetical protein HK098_007625, partial [Nowakowskiella sp. JEL0407]